MSKRVPSASRMSYKRFDGLKAEGESGKIKGYASSFDVEDEVGDVVVKGAFTNSIKERGDSRVILTQHDTFKNPIGSARIFEDEKGLGFEGKIVTSTTEGHDVYELIKAGVLTKMSIGYNILEEEWKDGIRLLKDIDLREISVVTFPANEDTEVGAVKSMDTIRKLASMKESELDEELFKELTDEEILDAEDVLKRIKKKRGMDDEEEKVDEEESEEEKESEDDDEEKQDDDEEEEKVDEEEISDEDLESAEDILNLLRDEDPDEEESSKEEDDDEDDSKRKN